MRNAEEWQNLHLDLADRHGNERDHFSNPTERNTMKTHILLIFIESLLLVCGGCANNPDAAGQVLSGVLMGIGQGLSGL